MAFIDIYKKQLFAPNFISWFINPFFILRSRLYKILKQEAPKLDGKVLDFGCGSKPYQQLFVNADKYIGIDIENEAHSHEKEDVDVFYDGENIPFEDNYFDSVFSSEVFEHVFNFNEIIKEVRRVLKPGGKMLITMPFAWNEHEVPHDFGRYTSFGVKHIFEENGFEVIEYRKSGHFAAVIAQYIPLYIYELIATKNKYLNLLLNAIFICPFTILGSIFSFILPKNKSLYFNNILLLKKV